MENIFENQYNDSVEKLKELSNLFQMDKIETFNFRKFIDQQIRKNFEISQNDEEKQILHLFSQNLFLKRSFLALNETLKRQSLINENLKKIIRDKLD
ncbi:hypothetical protein M0811_07518 [Anaeramoeba ignava]|uniref:Uncharacterized protein n=1 Tax=Anaeramoeba ignava TaxID=1746090 RepID=A0A9Q0LLM1_ANAIG|nr:hypothetical protein M0811_07518 [Anaeramoeba ignava]